MHGTEEKMKNFNMMKKLLALTLGAAMLLAVMTGCGKKDTAQEPADDQQQQQEEPQPAEPATLLEQIKAKGKVVVGTEAQYAPYEFKDLDANFAGCDMWLAQQIADSLGVELEVVDMAFDGIIPAVQSGQVDLGIAAFTNTPERAEEIDFSDLYETSAQLLIVKAGNADTYSTKESLVGLKVGAQKGTIQSQLIQSALPESELFELEKYPALALEVQNGNIAGLVVDQAVGEALVASSNGALEVSNFTFTAEEASFGKSVVIAKGNEDLVAVVNEVINKVTADGSYQKAYDEIMAQLEAVQKGQLEDWELEGARSTLLNNYATVGDSQGKLENFYLGQAATGQHETPADLARAIQDMTAERICRAMSTVKLDTVYFLKGKEAEA